MSHHIDSQGHNEFNPYPNSHIHTHTHNQRNDCNPTLEDHTQRRIIMQAAIL